MDTDVDWSSIIPPTTSTIGCTTVLTSRNHQDPSQSHTFLNIPINDVFLAKRGGVRSILVSTLMFILQQQILSEQGVSDDIARIISAVGSDQSDLETITISTLRVPYFGSDIQNPYYGCRSLGTLSSVIAEMEMPPTAIHARELLAVHSCDNSFAKHFVSTWAPYGLDLETHFIVILTRLSFSPLNGSPSFSRGISTSPAPISHRHSARPSPLFGTPVSADWLRGLSDSPNISRTNSPAPGAGASHYSHHSSSNSPVPFVAQNPQTVPSDTPVFGPGTPIETICHHYGITNDNICSAKFLTTERSLLSMVLNYQQMLHILVQLGLQELGAPFTATQTVTFTGGLTLSAGEVVKEFGWSAESFKHKRVWYEWAEDAATREWEGPPPARGSDSNYDIYQIWLAIKYFWKPQGPTTLGCFPSDAAQTVDGQAAKDLKQCHIDKYRTAITQCLKLRDVDDRQ